MSVFVDLKPDNVQGLARLASVCFQMESDYQALDAARRCLKLDPKNAVAKSIIGRIEARQAKERADEVIKPKLVADAGGLSFDFDNNPFIW